MKNLINTLFFILSLCVLISTKPTYAYANNLNNLENDRIWGDLSPRAMSSAKVVISGMSGTSHTIKVSFPYS